MAKGRTISASFITELDNKIIKLCDSISETIVDAIHGKEYVEEFKREYGKISYTRDGGLGLGAGKIQRDAICTRGRQGKAPFSNRNLRWHPLVVAENKLEFAKKIEKIEIDGQDDNQVLVFVIKDQKGKICKVPSDKVYELPERFVALPEHWYPHVDILKHWSDTLWTQNSCVIPAFEACDWWDAVETYSVLGIALAVDFYKADFDSVYQNVVNILKEQTINIEKKLPSDFFPTRKDDIVKCPLCLLNISEGLEEFRKSKRSITWQPAWRSSKKGEGEDSSIQIMHVNPLLENSIEHKASNVRYGHRWCNVAMTDHSLDETLDFMEFIVCAHKRKK